MRSAADLSGGQRRPVVQRVDLVRGKPLEEAILDHRLAAGESFLARLEDQIHRTVEPACARKITRRAEQHDGVAVVAAAVHPAFEA